jgi:hypothetical protein
VIRDATRPFFSPPGSQKKCHNRDTRRKPLLLPELLRWGPTVCLHVIRSMWCAAAEQLAASGCPRVRRGLQSRVVCRDLVKVRGLQERRCDHPVSVTGLSVRRSCRVRNGLSVRRSRRSFSYTIHLRMTDGGVGPPIPYATDDACGVSLNPSVHVIR